MYFRLSPYRELPSECSACEWYRRDQLEAAATVAAVGRSLTPFLIAVE